MRPLPEAKSQGIVHATPVPYCEASTLIARQCDAKSWPCGPCQKAGVPCVGGDITDGPDQPTVPRSLVKWLENEVSRLERGGRTPIDGSGKASESPVLSRTTVSPVGTPQSDSPKVDGANQPMAPLADVISRDLFFPWLGFSKDIPLPQFVLSNASLPSTDPAATPTYRSHTPSLSRTGPRDSMKLLQSIPKAVADFLLEVYISRTMAAYPIFHEKWLRRCHRQVIHGSTKSPSQQDPPCPYDIFTVCLVMALALTTAARSKQGKARDMAYKLFQHAIPHVADVLTNDLRGLQALVLLHSYGVMNPAAINVYFLSSYIIEACLDQGLHREDPKSTEVDILTRELKRRVFWTAWELDVSSSSSFGRPVTLLPEDITTDSHSDLEDSAIHPDHIDTRGRATKLIAGQVRIFRFIEVEVISVLMHENPMPNPDETLYGWMEGAERRIHAWHADVYRRASENKDPSLDALWEEMQLYSDIATPQVIVALFRPCPKIVSPTTGNLLKAFNAAIEVAKGYSKQANFGFGSQKYTFQPVHHVFSSAMVFLHTIRECLPDLVSRYSLEEMEDYWSSFTTFFSLTAERWPAASACRDEYQRHLEPLKQRYIQALESAAASMDIDMIATGEYLPPHQGWNSSIDSIGFENIPYHPLADMTSPNLWMDEDSTMVDWGEYFNMGPL